MIHVGDITKLNGATLEPVNCITGGSPCQDLSIAGKREGLAGERSGLFLEMVRVIKEMRQEDKKRGKTGINARPRFVIWENVPGAFTSNGGEDFRCVLEQFSRVADETVIIPRPENGKWQSAGCIVGDNFSLAWRTFDAQYWGVPQRRKRIALVADFGGQCAAEILFECEGLSGDITESGKEGEGAASDAGAGIEKTSRAISFQERAGKPGGGKGILIQDERTGALSTLNNQPVCYGISSYDSNAMKSDNPHSGVYEADTSRTLDLNGGNTACNQGGMAVVYRGDAITSPINASNPKPGDPCHTLTDDSRNYVVLENHPADSRVKISEDGMVQTLSSRMGTGGNQVPVLHRHEANYGIVRRLTPLECERLQGYPDNWTDIGEWVDSKGKTRKPADAPRYKALGNSIALPQWQWIIDRMAAYLPEDATLGSLFDGIGGFPLCWERTHGKGTARWASEIEEFPMAVTKKHFPEEGAIP